MPQHGPTLKALKRVALQAAKGAGLFHAVASSPWRRQRLLVLAFHSVALDEEYAWRRLLYFTPEEFQRRLRLLQRWRLNILPLGEAIDRLERGTLPPRSAVLTVDDGHADFPDLTWPALERAGYPATVYVTTYYSEKRLPVFPLMCSYLLWKGRRRRVLDADPAIGLPPVDLTHDVARDRAAEAIVDRANREGLDAEAKNARLGLLAARLDVDFDVLIRRRVLQIMTPEELRQVAARGADVQLHTHRHRTPLYHEEFTREILDNRVCVEAATGRPAVHFCYPSGVYHAGCLPWLQSLGVRSATTCVSSLAQRTDSPLMLPRLVDTAALNEIEIEGWLSGFSQFLFQRRIPDASPPMPVVPAAAK